MGVRVMSPGIADGPTEKSKLGISAKIEFFLLMAFRAASVSGRR
jgi:hypothetical protein